MIYGVFFQNLFALLFNFGRQKNLLLVYLTFRDPWDSKKGKVKKHGLEILRPIQWAKIGLEGPNMLQMRG
jgi:hypothetical protein